MKLKKKSQEKDSKDKQLYQSMFNKDTTRYNSILPQIQSSIEDETNLVTIQATIVAILHEELNIIKNNQITRTVIYGVQSNGDLLLGPFQGRKTIQRIRRLEKVGHICWRALERKECFISENKEVDLPKSEIAVPIFNIKAKATGVLYLDSSSLSAFNEKDRDILSQVAKLLTSRWPIPRVTSQTETFNYNRIIWFLIPTSILFLLFRTSFKPLLNYY